MIESDLAAGSVIRYRIFFQDIHILLTVATLEILEMCQIVRPLPNCSGY
jgi:hypothetical protein